MASPLAGSLRKTIGKAMKALFLPGTISVSSTTAGAEPWKVGAQTWTDYPCRMIHEEYSERLKIEGLVNESNRKFLVLADGLSIEPAAGNRVTFQGKTYTVRDVSTDPARAAWVLHTQK